MATQTKPSPAAAQMIEAAQKLLDSLTPAQRSKATFDYYHGERVLWYYPPLNQNGIPLKEINDKQRDLAFALLASGLSPVGYHQARAIMDHEVILREIEKKTAATNYRRDPDMYFFSVFGAPDSKGPWGWRAQGHHISLHFSVFDGQVISLTPFFFGSNPAEVREGPKKGLRILDACEDLAFELMNSLDSGQRGKTIVSPEAPFDILTFNATRACFLDNEGLPASTMSATQKQILMALITHYVARVRTDLSQQKLDQLKKEGLDGLHLTWAGSTDKSRGHYYRIAGGNFLIEFDNRQNDANHIHSVWRDVENDFGMDVLQNHLLIYHNTYSE